MNYDHEVLGVGNLNHPANANEIEVVFESENIQECLDYYKLSGEIEPLENAISLNEENKKKAFEDLVTVIKLMRSKGYTATANFLCSTRDKLK
jgi:cystathionine beta-lyase family protein involved in aluminum resistance